MALEYGGVHSRYSARCQDDSAGAAGGLGSFMMMARIRKKVFGGCGLVRKPAAVEPSSASMTFSRIEDEKGRELLRAWVGGAPSGQ